MAIAPGDGISKAQAKAATAAARAAANKKAARAAANKKAAKAKVAAPTSGLIPGFTPSVVMPKPAVKPGKPGFVGPVASTTYNDRVINAIKSGTQSTTDVDGNPVIDGADDDTITPDTPPENFEPVRTMAIDTFKQTLALFFGAEEMAQPWVNALYGVTSKYYKTGSTIDESLNLALQDVRNNPELAPFTKRFKGLYDLQDRFAKGEVVQVPTIAGFFKSQQALGDVLVKAGLPELNNRELLGNILGTGKSVLETTALINDVFGAIDNAPAALKEDLQKVAPGADRTSIAKALLLGKEGAAALSKQIAATTVFSAAKSQGLLDEKGMPTVSMETAADYAARGFDYGASLTGFGTVARNRASLERLTEISTGKAVTPEQAQTTLQQSVFENNVAAQQQIDLEAKREAARYGGRPGTIGSRSLASRNRANRTI
jgi:hypothetical protein